MSAAGKQQQQVLLPKPSLCTFVIESTKSTVRGLTENSAAAAVWLLVISLAAQGLPARHRRVSRGGGGLVASAPQALAVVVPPRRSEPATEPAPFFHPRSFQGQAVAPLRFPGAPYPSRRPFSQTHRYDSTRRRQTNYSDSASSLLLP